MRNKIWSLLAAPGLALALSLGTAGQVRADDYYDYYDYYWDDYYYDDIYDDYGWDYEWTDGWVYETPYGEWEYEDTWGNGYWEFEDDWWS